MATYTSAAAYAARQKQLLTQIKLYEAPFQLAVRTVLGEQAQRIFERGENERGGPIGQYDTTRPFYVNPKKAPRAVGFSKQGYNLQGLLPTRGNPSASLIVEPEGEHTFTEQTYFRGVKGTQPGDPHRTTWVKNMKDYRNRIGRRVDRVNLELTGDLRLDWSSALLGKERVKQDGNGSLTLTVGVKRAVNAAKLETIAEKYGPVFRLSARERDLYFRALRYELRRAVEELRGGA